MLVRSVDLILVAGCVLGALAYSATGPSVCTAPASDHAFRVDPARLAPPPPATRDRPRAWADASPGAFAAPEG